MILLRGFFSSGTEGSGLVLWLPERESLLEPVLKMVLLIRTGGAGGLSSGSLWSHMVRVVVGRQPSSRQDGSHISGVKKGCSCAGQKVLHKMIRVKQSL